MTAIAALALAADARMYAIDAELAGARPASVYTVGMNKMSLTISLTALLSLAGCVEDDVATCTGPGLPGICIEYTESSAAAREMCAIGVNDRFEPGNVCPGEARLGGCRVVHSNSEGVIEETTWFYPGATRDTEEEIRSFCDLFVGEYLPPS